MSIPIPKNLFGTITPGRQSAPLRQVRGSLGGLQIPARGNAGVQEAEQSKLFSVGGRLFAQEHNAQVIFESNELKKKAEIEYFEVLAFNQANSPDDPEQWRTNAVAASQKLIDDGTSPKDSIFDVMSGNNRRHQELTTHIESLNARNASVEHDGIFRKKVRQADMAKITLLAGMATKINRLKTDKANGAQSPEVLRAGGEFNYLRDETVGEVNDQVKHINSLSRMNPHQRTVKIDELVEAYGETLVAAMSEFEPDALHQHLADMKLLFSPEFNHDKLSE